MDARHPGDRRQHLANALHAIRLNEQARLHLNNATVGALSAIAPLALAGAVYLYLVINRHLAANKAMAAEPPTAKAPSGGPPPPAAKSAATAIPAKQRLVQPTATPEPKPPAAPASPATTATAPPPATATPPRKATPKPGGRKASAPDAYLLKLARQMRYETGTVRRTDLERTARAQATPSTGPAQKAADTVLDEAATTKNLATTA